MSWKTEKAKVKFGKVEIGQKGKRAEQWGFTKKGGTMGVPYRQKRKKGKKKKGW